MAEPENHALHPLREMRGENRAFREKVRESLEQARQERQAMREQLDSITSAVGGLSCIQADQRLHFEELEARVRRIEDRLDMAPAGSQRQTAASPGCQWSGPGIRRGTSGAGRRRRRAGAGPDPDGGDVSPVAAGTAARRKARRRWPRSRPPAEG